jgi:hypothetical protein
MSLGGRHSAGLTQTGKRGLSERTELRVGEDVEQLDVEPRGGQTRQLGDAVLLLEAEDELGAGVVRARELVEAKGERGGLLSCDEDDTRLDVVRAVELVALAESDLPILARSDPLLQSRSMHGEVFVDLDRDECVALRAFRVDRPRGLP